MNVPLPDTAAAEALANLLGWSERPGGAAVRVQLAPLEATLAHAGLPPAAELAAQLVGPVADRRALRAAASQERIELWDWLFEHPTVLRLGLTSWAEQVRAGGVIGSPARTRALLADALAVIVELPADAEPLAVLAGRILGDPHALDEGKRLANLVLRAVASGSGGELPNSAPGRRELWDRVGVRTDELSSTILLAGQWQPGSGVVAELLAVAGGYAQAVPMTLSMCRAAPPPPPVGGVVHVVENPAVLATAVAQLGTTCPALACTAGWPSAAGLRLLGSLRSQGVELLYHGDFDADGLRIADYLVIRLGAAPWLMAAQEYRKAVAQRPTRPGVSNPTLLDPARIPQVPWAPGLREAMTEHRVAVYEEQVVASLVADLQR